MTGRSTDEIEREIEAERGALARSLEELQRQVSPDALIDRAAGLLRENGSEIATSAVRQARANPIALAVTGAGLAWLIAGPAKDRRGVAGPAAAKTLDRPPLDNATAEPDLAYDDRARPTVGGFRASQPRMAGFDARLAAAEGDRWETEVGFERRTFEDDDTSYRAKLAAAADHIADTVSSWFDDDDNDDATAAVGDDDLRARLKKGTDTMTETARNRVIAARQAAYDAQRRLDRRARDYAASGRETMKEQPLILALAALGVGAAIGAMLPRTRREDAYLGAYSDRAMGEAERIYRAETAKLRAVAEAAVEEAKHAATDALNELKSDVPSGERAVSTAEAKVQTAATRVTDAAKAEAEKRNLGSSLN